MVDRNAKHLALVRASYKARLDRQESGEDYPSDWIVSDSKLSMKALDIFERTLGNLPISGNNFHTRRQKS